MTDQKIKRINELAHKSKTPGGLTEEEKKEQAVLRREFIDSVKGNLKAQLDNINIQEKDGSITHVRDIPKKKNKIM